MLCAKLVPFCARTCPGDGRARLFIFKSFDGSVDSGKTSSACEGSTQTSEGRPLTAKLERVIQSFSVALKFVTKRPSDHFRCVMLVLSYQTENFTSSALRNNGKGFREKDYFVA